MIRISNRRHPVKKCKNPACQKNFTPHDRRQLYCCRQCQIDAGNDKRHHEDQTVFADIKSTRKNRKILKQCCMKINDEKIKTIPHYMLRWSGFEFKSQSLATKNNDTGRIVKWFGDYGLEMIDNEKKIYEIHFDPSKSKK